MKRILLISAALAFAGTMSFAAVSPEAIASEYLAKGYTAVEVTTGRTQTKVEAIGPSGKIETIYDTATGTVLKQETGVVRRGDHISEGVELRKRNRDFVKVRKSGSADDSSNDDSPGHDANDDHGNDGPGHDAHDDHGNDNDGHDSNDDHGGNDDDHGSDDHGKGGNDDNSGRDHDNDD